MNAKRLSDLESAKKLREREAWADEAEPTAKERNRSLASVYDAADYLQVASAGHNKLKR